jgi:hypothetical protein
MLVYSTGKILSDDSPIKEYKIDDKSFVVVMVTKVGIDRFRFLNKFYFS